MRSPIWWFGGKGNLVSKLLALVPGHHTYVEAFGGGASLLFAKEPSPMEVYNDVNRGLVDFFRVLRDPDLFEAFHRLISLTPYARVEHEDCWATWHEQADPVERARRWYVVARQSFGGKFGRSWRKMVAGTKGGAVPWVSTIEGLPEVHARLMRVQIECIDWRECLRAYDTPQTFFYLDPPFVLGTRGVGRYVHELTNDDHRDLVEAILGLSGLVLLSGYAHPIYEPLEDAGWDRIDWEVTVKKQKRVESVWINYPNPIKSSGGREYRQGGLF